MRERVLRLGTKRMRILDKLKGLIVVFRTFTTGVTTMLQNYYEDGASCPVASDAKGDCRLLQRFRDYMEVMTRRLQDVQYKYDGFVAALEDAFSGSGTTPFEVAIKQAVENMVSQLEEFIGDPAEAKVKSSVEPLMDHPNKRDGSHRAKPAIYRAASPTLGTTPDRIDAVGSPLDWARNGAQRLQIVDFGTLVGLMQELTVMSTSLKKKLRSIAKALKKIVTWLYGDIVLLLTIQEVLTMLKGTDSEHLLREAVRNIYLRHIAIDESRKMEKGRVQQSRAEVASNQVYRAAMHGSGLGQITKGATQERCSQVARIDFLLAPMCKACDVKDFKDLLCMGYAAPMRDNAIRKIQSFLQQILDLEKTFATGRKSSVLRDMAQPYAHPKLLRWIAKGVYYFLLFAPFGPPTDNNLTKMHEVLTDQGEPWSATMFDVVSLDMLALVNNLIDNAYNGELLDPVSRYWLAPKDKVTPKRIILQVTDILFTMEFLKVVYILAAYKTIAKKRDVSIMELRDDILCKPEDDKCSWLPSLKSCQDFATFEKEFQRLNSEFGGPVRRLRSR